MNTIEWQVKKDWALASRKKGLPIPKKKEKMYYSPKGYLYGSPKEALPQSQYLAAITADAQRLASFKSDAQVRDQLAKVLNNVYEGKVPRKVPYVEGHVEKQVTLQEIFDEDGKLKDDLNTRHVMLTIIYTIYGVIFPYDIKFLDGRPLPPTWRLDGIMIPMRILNQLEAVKVRGIRRAFTVGFFY